MANNNEIPVEFIKTNSTQIDTVKEQHPGAIIHLHNEDGDEDLYIGECRITDNFNLGKTDPSGSTRKVGGLDVTTFGQLISFRSPFSRVTMTTTGSPSTPSMMCCLYSIIQLCTIILLRV